MKRILLLATVALAIVSCSNDPLFETETDSPYNPSEIVVFSTSSISRGTPINDAAQLIDIGTFGYYTGQNQWTPTDLPNRMFNRRLYRNAEGMWKYEGAPVEWNNALANDLFTFYAYAPYATGMWNSTTNATGNGIVVNGNSSTTGIPTLTYTVPADVTRQPDLMVAMPRVDIIKPANGYVTLAMEHALTTVGFQVTGNGEKIAGISISGVSMTGTLAVNGDDIEWTNLSAPDTSTDFSASINFDSGRSYYTATPTMSTNLMAGNGYLMMIPQTLGSNAVLTVTYDDNTTLDINFDAHEWLPGKKITYQLTIVPGGVIIVEPSIITLPQTASSGEAKVICADEHGNPVPSLPWTLTTSETWLTLSLSSDDTGASQTLSGTGTQTFYAFATANNATNADRTATIMLNDETNVVVTVRQNYCMAQRFARSNIVMYIDSRGNKILTFAETENDHTVSKSVTYYDASTSSTVTGTVPAIAANVQGLHFRWGSLVGVTSDRTTFNNGTSGVVPSHVVFWPAEYASRVPGAWVFSDQSASGQVPYTGSSDIGANPYGNSSTGYGIDAFSGYPGGTGPGFDKANAKGDICRYISDMGWVQGKWRMPTTAEIIALLGETPEGYTNIGRVLGTWDGSEGISDTGKDNKYGYSTLGSVRIVGKGVTGGELARNSLPNPGAAKVVFPAAGYRGASNGNLNSTGYYANYWAATPGNGSGLAYELDYNDLYNYHSYNMSIRASGFSVRCIKIQ